MSQDSGIAEIYLRIFADGKGLRVTIEAPGGTASAPFEPSVRLLELVAKFSWLGGATARNRRDLKRRKNDPRPDLKLAAGIGDEIYRALLPAEILRCFDLSPAPSRRLRLTWDPADPRLAILRKLPWELIRNPATGIFLVLDSRLSLLRFLPLAEIRPPPARPATLRILGFGPCPGDLEPLDLEGEWAALAALAAQEKGLKIFQPAACDTLDPQTLRRCLEERAGHVLHFMGHGDFEPNGEGCLVFVDTAGRPLIFSGAALAQTLSGLTRLRLVVLNACYGAAGDRPFGEVAAALVRGGVPAVLAMQSAITDEAARIFSAELYRQLAHGKRLDHATCEGRQAIFNHNPTGLEWALPVLFVHPGGESLFDEDRLSLENQASEQLADAEELRHRYLALMIERHRQVELPWLPALGSNVPMPLDSLFALFRPDPTPAAERPLQAADLEKEKQRLEKLLSARDLGSGQEEPRLWQDLHRLARGETGPAETPGDPAGDAEDLAWDGVARHRFVVLLGESGSGKTHLLRFLARHLAETSLQGRSHLEVPAPQVDCRRDHRTSVRLGPARLPILVDLPLFARERRQDPGLRLVNYLGKHLGTTLTDGATAPDGELIEPGPLHALLRRELTAGRAMLLLDGLDAVGDAAERQGVVREIENLREHWLSAGKDGGARLVIASRPAGYPQASCGKELAHFRLQPMRRQAIAAFCRRWAAAAGDPPGPFENAAEQLRQQEATEWVSTPLMLTLLATILARGGGVLPVRQLDRYEPAVAVLIARWQELAGADPCEAGLGSRRLRELLAELAAELHGRPERLGLIERKRLVGWLGARLADWEPAALERLLRRDLGPLVSYGNSLFGFLHQALQAYLAACWLAADPDQAEARLRQHLADPLWRQPSAMALGLLAERLGEQEWSDLTRRLGCLPASGDTIDADLLGLAMVTELPAGYERWTSALLTGLLRRAAGAGGPWLATVETAIVSLIEKGAAPVAFLVRMLAAATERAAAADDNDQLAAREAIASLARIAAGSSDLLAELAGGLEAAEPFDLPPWPVTTCLRRLADRHPALLPGDPGTLRRKLAGDRRLLRATLGHPAWRRLLYALLGGQAGRNAFRSSPLEARLLEAILAGDDPRSLVDELARRTATFEDPGRDDAGIALFALGAAARLPDGAAAWRGTLERLAARLGPPQAAPERLLIRLLEQSADERQGAALLALLWRRLLRWVPPEEDPRHRLAIFLDTRGALACGSLPRLVESFLGAAGGAIAPSPGSHGDRLRAALRLLAALPRVFDFVRGWALSVLRPLLEAEQLLQKLPETPAADFNEANLRQTMGLAIAAFEAASTRPQDDLVLLRLMLDEDPGLAPWAWPPPEVPALDPGRLELAIDLLDGNDDRKRLEAAFLLHGGHGPLRRRWSARELGLATLMGLARHWLALRYENPRPALVLRWTLQNLEHDSPALLLKLAELCGHGGDEGEQAEALLENLEVIDPECGPALAEILRSGAPAARLAVVRGLPNAISARAVSAQALWAALAEILPRMAPLGEESEKVDLAEPMALVEAAAQALQESAAATGALPDTLVRRARTLYAAHGRTWAAILQAGGELKECFAGIGRRRRLGQAEARIRPTAEALAERSDQLPVLVAWLESRLRQQIRRRGLDDHEPTFLLELLAATARRVPNTFFAATAGRPRWRQFLGEAAIHLDWLPGRIAALDLLSFGQVLGKNELAALLTAMLDTAEVQERALASLPRYRRLEFPGILAELAAELKSPSAARAYAAGRLLAALGRPGLGDPETRLAADRILYEAAQSENARQEVYLAAAEPPGSASLGTLAQKLENLRLEMKVAAGFPEIPPRTAAGPFGLRRLQSKLPTQIQFWQGAPAPGFAPLNFQKAWLLERYGLEAATAPEAQEPESSEVST